MPWTSGTTMPKDQALFCGLKRRKVVDMGSGSLSRGRTRDEAGSLPAFTSVAGSLILRRCIRGEAGCNKKQSQKQSFQ